MAFAYSVTDIKRLGPHFIVSYGTYTNGAADSGGDILTGLSNVLFFAPACSSHLGSEFTKVTRSAGTVTIVTSDGTDGEWFAFGY